MEQTINAGAGGGDDPVTLAAGLNAVPNGPTVTVPRPGDYMVNYGATFLGQSGSSANLGVDGGGLAANVAPMLQFLADTDPVGTVKGYRGASLPSGWLLADGSTVNRATYPDLADAMGIASSATTFVLPDLRNRFAYGASALASQGATGGEATHLLSNAEMPTHAHGGATGGGTSGAANTDHCHSGTTSGTSMGALGLAGGPQAGFANNTYSNPNYTASTFFGGSFDHSHTYTTNWQSQQGGNNAANHSHSVPALAIGNDGGGQAHNNLPPYLQLAQIIKAVGVVTAMTGSLSVRRTITSAGLTLAMWASATGNAQLAARYLSVQPIRVG